MKWRNHLDIADAVADALSLSPYQREVLRQASVEPDKNGERVLRFDRKGQPYLRWMRHHRPEVEVIESLAWKGRLAFLEGREDDAIWCLGKALHFLQDYCVSIGPFGVRHDGNEDAISEYRVSRETVVSAVRGSTVSVAFMRQCLRSVKPCRDPMMALNQAGIFSGALAASVLRGTSPDRGLLDEWQRTRRRFRLAVIPVSLLIAVGAPAMSLLANEPLIALFALPALLAPWYYRHYCFLKEEMAWFGL
jgi:hypothetical protein